MEQQIIEAAARAAHEANRAWCIAHGDTSQAAWDHAPEWQRASALEGIRGVLRGNGPEAQHEDWCRSKLRDGWRWGEVKDPVEKTHPCLVPYAALPPEQRAKDAIYIAVVRAVLTASGFVLRARVS